MWKQRTEELWKREPFSIGWSRAIWENEGTKDHLRVAEGASQRSGQGAPRAEGRASADIQRWEEAWYASALKGSPVKPRVARASERKKPGRLWVCRDKKDWCFPWQNKNHGNTLSKQMSLQNFTFYIPRINVFQAIPRKDMSITYKLVVLQDEPQQCQEAGEESSPLTGSPHATYWLS